ncbi:hypothetical protein BXZ70DRAFT_627309 [Cristinia sonorae]|uniref:Uncharacterized protein n=1 Tax=Cristinia sonorae TaxID=1940300 RepID=A0A8K0UFK8_9AGAR|nr:hypothetical protein BXZ70DRAFT_627309 [Cristinia sonorae]
MEKLLKDIDTDVSSITSSRKTGSSFGSSSTLVGTGPAVPVERKKSVMLASVDKLLAPFAGLERVVIQKRMNEISTHMDAVFIPPKVYEDLLEYQRVGLYRDVIRFRAWDLILVLLERRRTEGIIDNIVKWPEMEIQLFLRQLSVFKLSGWTMHPAKYTPIKPTSSSSPHPNPPVNRDEILASSYRNIVGSLVQRNPYIIQELFDVNQFILLELDKSDPDILFDDGKCLDYFFDVLGREPTPKDKEKWPLPAQAAHLVEFLTVVDRGQSEEVVDYILRTLPLLPMEKPLPVHTDTPLVSPVLQMHTERHPAVRFLWFTLHLTSRSSVAASQLLHGGFLAILEEIIRDDTMTEGREDVVLLICMLVGVISAKDLCDFSLYYHLGVKHTDLFLAILPTFTQNYRAINAFRGPHCEGELPNDLKMFYKELLDHLSCIDPAEDMRGWDELLNELAPGRTYLLADALLDRFAISAQQVIMNLVRLRMTGRGFNASHAPSISHAVHESVGPENPCQERLTALRSLIRKVTKRGLGSALIDNSASIDALAVVYTDYILPVELPRANGFAIFFDTLVHATQADLYTPCSLPPLASAYVEQLQTTPARQLQDLVNYLLDAIASNIRSGGDASADSERRRSTAHTLLSLLNFVIHLSKSSSDASKLFIASDFPALLLTLLSQHSLLDPETGDDHGWSQTRILLAFGALAIHHTHTLKERLRDTIFDEVLETLAPRLLFVTLYIQIPKSRFYDLTAPILNLSTRSSVHSYVLPMPDGPRFSKHPWEQLIATFADIRHDQHDQSKQWATKQVLLFAASVEEESWGSLSSIMYRVPTGMRSMFYYIITSYLGCHTPRGLSGDAYTSPTTRLSAQTEAYLKHLAGIAESRGFEVTNPVDRFISLTALATRAERAAVEGICMDEMLGLIGAVLRGRYDVVPLTNVQRERRVKECNWMQFQIEHVKANSDF